jgi:hypothetical protein
MNSVYQSSQMTSAADLPPELLTDLDLLAGDVRDRLQAVSVNY